MMKTKKLHEVLEGISKNYTLREDGKLFGKSGELKLKKNKDGYLTYNLYITRKKGLHVGLHRMLALCFIPNPKGLGTVDHIDKNRLNNSLSNLRWASRKEQAANRNERKDQKYLAIIKDGVEIERGIHYRIVKKFNLNLGSVYRCLNGKVKLHKGFTFKRVTCND